MRRQAARVIVLDDENNVLLLRGGDPSNKSDETWWFTPGGGLEGAESPVEAARRELREETGLDVAELTGPIHSRTTVFTFDNILYEQDEDYYLARVPRFAVMQDGWTELERRSLIDWRWWSLAELESTKETVYPEDLTSVLRRIESDHDRTTS